MRTIKSLGLCFLICLVLTGCWQTIEDTSAQKPQHVRPPYEVKNFGWVEIEITELTDVQFFPKTAFSGHSALILRFQNGRVIIYNDLYFNVKNFKIGQAYRIERHKVTRKIRAIAIKKDELKK